MQDAAAAGQRGIDDVAELAATSWRAFHRNLQRYAADRRPAGGNPAASCTPGADLENHPALLGDLEERLRCEHAARRMTPAQQASAPTGLPSCTSNNGWSTVRTRGCRSRCASRARSPGAPAPRCSSARNRSGTNPGRRCAPGRAVSAHFSRVAAVSASIENRLMPTLAPSRYCCSPIWPGWPTTAISARQMRRIHDRLGIGEDDRTHCRCRRCAPAGSAYG